MRVGLCSLEKGLGWFCEDDTFASACWHCGEGGLGTRVWVARGGKEEGKAAGGY